MRHADSSAAVPLRRLCCDPLLLLIATGGLFLRWVLSLQRPGLLLEDADGYLAHAEALLELGRFAGPFTGESTAFRPPGFVLLLSIPLTLGFGSGGAVLAVQLAMSLLCFWGVAVLAVLFGLPRSMMLLAVAGVACDPLLLLYSIQPMSEVPCAAVLVAAFALYVRSGAGGWGAVGTAAVTGRSRLLAVLAGMLFAMGGLIRPAVLPAAGLCFVAGAVGWLHAGRPWMAVTGGLRSTNWEGPGLVFAAVCGFAAGLFPWVLRNGLVFGSLIPATTHGGYTLALGNNPDFYRDVIHQSVGNPGNGYPWRGEYLEAWQQRTLAEAAKSGVRPGDEMGLDRWYYGHALSSIRDDWTAFRKACVLRLLRFWAVTGTMVSGGVTDWLIGAWYTCWWCGLVSALVCRRTRGYWPLAIQMWICVAVFCLLHLVYWTDTRMRAPVMPLLIVLSLGGIRSLVVCVRERLRSRV